MSLETNIDNLGKVIENLKKQISEGPLMEFDARIEDISSSASNINSIFDELKTILPEAQVKELGIDEGLSEINNLIEQAKLSIKELNELQEKTFKKD